MRDDEDDEERPATPAWKIKKMQMRDSAEGALQ